MPVQTSQSQRLNFLPAMSMILLMILVPINSFSTDREINDSINSDFTNHRSWGESGFNDTGWIDFVANGSDIENGTPALGEISLEFAPGAMISNLTLEVEVNGSDGYWINQPQLNILNTQTNILDWRGQGDFGRQNNFLDYDSTVSDGILDSSLKPNTISDASWQIPTGIEITDLIIEALRPVDPKLSLTSKSVEIHDSEVNPFDGRLYLLVDDDLLHIDDNSEKKIIDIHQEIYGRSIQSDSLRDILYIGRNDGNVTAMRLSDSSIITDFPNDVKENNSNSILSMTLDNNGIIWATSECEMHYLMPLKGAIWQSENFCLGSLLETPTDIITWNNRLYISTENSGLHVINYNLSNSGLVEIEKNTVWDKSNFLSDDSISNIEISGDILYVATSESGINRLDLSSTSWLATWTENNWLLTDDIISIQTTPGWLYILSENYLQSYNTNALYFSSDIQLSSFGLYGSGTFLGSWISGSSRSPSNSTAIISDSSGTIGRVVGDNPDGQFVVVSSPSIENADICKIIEDDDQGEVWITNGSIIDMMDIRERLWKTPIDISSYVSNPGSITSIVQDENGWVWIGTSQAGTLRLSNIDGSYLETIQGLNSNQVSSMAYDSDNDFLVIGHPDDGISLYSTLSNSVYSTFTVNDGLDSNSVMEITTRYGIAYVATQEEGIMRIDLDSQSILGSWKSLGIDNLDAAPIAVDDDIIYMGLYGFGILLIDRITSEIIDLWTAEDPNSFPDNDINTLEIDFYGGLLVGSEVPQPWSTQQPNGALARWDGTSWELLPTVIPGNWNDPFEFYDLTSDASGIFAGTNRGACMWSWGANAGSIELEDCWSNTGGDALPSRFVNSVEHIGQDFLYAGTNQGAAIINISNGSVVEIWTAGDDTQRAKILKYQDILYLGFENIGIARYNLTTKTWLPIWDGSFGIIDDDDVTALIEGETQGTIWAGGDFGLTLIDVINETSSIKWNRGTNQDGPTLPEEAPGELLLIDGIIYYSPQRGQQWNSRDQVTRIDISSNSTLETMDAGEWLGYDGIIYDMSKVGNEIWIGIGQSGWGGNIDDGTIIRWNLSTNYWSDNLETIDDVGRVNAQYLGDCFPYLSTCELWVAYGDNILRRFSAGNMTLLDQWDDIDGRIRGMVEYQGEYLFASMNGILRWNPDNETWLESWLPDSGLPSESEIDFYSMKVIGDDLWASSGSGDDGLILQLSGNNSNWSTWPMDTSEIPDGYGADIIVCDDIIHFAIGFTDWRWWVTGGGIARFDLADHDGNGISNEWLTPSTTSNSDLSNRDPRALACDEINKILYVGFDEENIGIDRYSYDIDSFLPTITEQDGISSAKVFPGGMLHYRNTLLISHYEDGGGISVVFTSGNTFSNGQTIGTGIDSCSIVPEPNILGIVPWESYSIGRSGADSGINRVDRLDSSGLIEGGIDALVGLTSGQVHDMISNETHVWVTVAGSRFSYSASTILQGEFSDNNTIVWQHGYQFQSESISEILLVDDEIWLTTMGNGLWSINLTDKLFIPTPTSLHNQMDGIIIEDEKMYVGLIGMDGSSAGFQAFSPEDRQWGQGSLIAGLPNNAVNDFIEYEDHILVATDGGIGLWNTTKSDWDNPITSINGLPNSIITHLFIPPSPLMSNGTIITGGPNGLAILDSNFNFLGEIGRLDGLIGDSVAGITYADASTRVVNDSITGNPIILHHDAALFISHDGFGSTRPGVSAWDLATDKSNGTYNIDMLPSNEVTAITSDYWGVHIATSSEPMVHWNGTSMTMESGPGAFNLQGWPVTDLTSDGIHLSAISSNRISVFAVDGNHEVKAQKSFPGAVDIDSNSEWLIAIDEDGLHAFSNTETLQEMPRVNQRRAEPLNVIYDFNTWEITETTHPGMPTVLASADNPIAISLDPTQEFSEELILYPGKLTFSSPQDWSWIWARSNQLNYTGSWDFASINPSIVESFQTSIFSAEPGSMSSFVNLQLQSPKDGKIKIRLTYDWERLESPTIITSLVDRPNDGGGVLIANWLPAQDSAWTAYRLYIWDSTDIPDWTPTKDDLEDFSIYERIPFWTQTSTEFYFADKNGTQTILSDTRQYRSAISIEYPDGSLGEPISWSGNTTPTDEIPNPPDWIKAEPISGGTPGTLSLEWSACEELDPQFSRIWAVKQEITNAIALPDSIDISSSAGNSTVLNLDPDSPYWLAIVCVDESGQSKPSEATIFGPVVTAGGLNDGIAPMPITDTVAFDVPNDEGGQIQVTWTPNSEEDCSYHVIYILPATGWIPPTSVEGWPVAEYIPDCSTNTSIIDSIGDSNLENGIYYWIGVVAVDDWGNQDVENVLVVEMTPNSQLDSSSGLPPDLVANLQAWDHPMDDGTAIDISWDRSEATDFSYYTVWVSDYPLDDLTQLSSQCSQNDNCDLIIVNQRQIGNSKQLELTVNKALYGTNIETLKSEKIIPSIPLYVAVTVHDINGNVKLTGMDQIMSLVTPIDNRGDSSPPNRIPSPILTDRTSDSGNAIFVEFEPSDANDIAEYRIYAVAGSPIDNVENIQPAMVVYRGENNTVLLEQYSNGSELVADIPVWVVVVAVDGSGNAWQNDLESSMISPVDELSQDPGFYLPEITGLIVFWESSGFGINVIWDISEEEVVKSYSVYASNTEFSDTREALLISSGITNSNFSFNSLGPSSIDTSQTYWISVVASDGIVNRFSTSPISLLPLQEYNLGNPISPIIDSDESLLDQLMNGDLNTIIAIFSALMILIGGILILRPKESIVPEPWEMGTQEIEELEEEFENENLEFEAFEDTQITESTDSISEDLISMFDDELSMPASSSVQEDTVSELMSEESEEIDLEDLNELADDLEEKVSNSDDIDTSFIDDVLDG